MNKYNVGDIIAIRRSSQTIHGTVVSIIIEIFKDKTSIKYTIDNESCEGFYYLENEILHRLVPEVK